MNSRSDDAIECRIEINRDFADVYAEAGPNFPMYEDEKWVCDAPLLFFENRGLKIERDRVSIPNKTLNEMRYHSSNG